MRVLHIIDSLDMGGAENLLIPFTYEQKKRGCDVSVLLLKKAHHPEITNIIQNNGIPVSWLIEKGSLYNPLLIFKLRPIISKYDVVHVHLFPALYWAGFAKLLTRDPVQLVFTEHSTSDRRRTHPLLKHIDRLIYSSAYSFIVACSEKAYETFCSVFPKVNHVCYVNNGVNTKQFRDSKPYSKQDLLGIPENCFVVTMVARFMFMKRQDTVVKAISKLPDRFHACFVGGEPSDEGVIKLMHLAKTLGVSARVHFLYIRSDVPRILKTSDVLVLSSEYEGLSLSSIEGMAAGKPFIATDVNGLREVVKDAGVLFELYNSDQLASILSQLAEDKHYYDSVALQCRERAASYDIVQMVDNYMKVYLHIVDKGLVSQT